MHTTIRLQTGVSSPFEPIKSFLPTPPLDDEMIGRIRDGGQDGLSDVDPEAMGPLARRTFKAAPGDLGLATPRGGVVRWRIDPLTVQRHS